MKIKFILSLFLLLEAGILSAQNFNPGYLITREQDTLDGFILDKTDAGLAHGIQFKNKITGPVVNYDPVDLQVFGFRNGRFFESMELPGSGQEKTKKVFAKNIVRGEIDLYVWRHEGRAKPDFFVLNNTTGKSAYLKKPERREVVQRGKSYKTEDQYYLGNLHLVKGETGKTAGPRFSEKKIKKDIIKYNTRYELNVPLLIYEDEVAYTFDIMWGIPIQRQTDYSLWRASVFINRNRPERTRNFFLTYGVYFENYINKREYIASFRNGYSGSDRQILNVMPIALKYQGDGKIFQPYGYLGGGIAGLWYHWDKIEDYNITGTRVDFGVFPNFILGVGTRVKMGPAAFIAEISPSFRGVFLSAGISF